MGFSGGSDHKESTYNAKDMDSVPGLERSTGEGNGYPLQYSCLGDSMDREAWQATSVRGVAKSWARRATNPHTNTWDSPAASSINQTEEPGRLPSMAS